jgi:NADH dehydrogenase (ubiquinone) 1 alpha subcomplex subunit 9
MLSRTLRRASSLTTTPRASDGLSAALIGSQKQPGVSLSLSTAPAWMPHETTKKWAGGRVVTVFGATGFLGRYAVNNLARTGATVVVPYRGSKMDVRHLRVCGDVGQIVPIHFNPKDPAAYDALVGRSNEVVNLIGRAFETSNYSFDDVHVAIAKRIAEACQRTGVARLVHVSSQGADAQSPSELLRTKALGEEAVRAAFPGAVVLRPCPVFGHEDTLTNRYASLAAKTRRLRMPVLHDLSSKWQPVYSVDVAKAIVEATLGSRSAVEGKVFELGGPEVKTFERLIEDIYALIREEPRYLQLPNALAGLAAAVVEKVQRRPLFTLDSMNVASLDRTASPELPGLKELGISPTRFETVGIRWLRKYRHYRNAGKP